jgi:NAD-dependent dihydropyrimidine dehydrogenase PreA subunit
MEKSIMNAIICKSCSNTTFYGEEEPPEKDNLPITVWRIKCINCGNVVLVKSDYD